MLQYFHEDVSFKVAPSTFNAVPHLIDSARYKAWSGFATSTPFSDISTTVDFHLESSSSVVMPVNSSVADAARLLSHPLHQSQPLSAQHRPLDSWASGNQRSTGLAGSNSILPNTELTSILQLKILSSYSTWIYLGAKLTFRAPEHRTQ